MDESNHTICLYCEVEITDYESHEKPSDNSSKMLSCKNCDLVLVNQECLEHHKKIVHDMAQKVFSCEMCNIDFSAKKYLFIHKDVGHEKDENLSKLENETEIDPFDIKVEIQDSNDLNENDEEYVKSLKTDVDPEPIEANCNKELKCNQCQKHFTTKANLTKHYKAVHQAIRNHKCKECEKLFTCKSNLKEHMIRLHESNRDFHCQECKSTFKTKGGLKQHIEGVHQKPMNHKCTLVYFDSKAALSHFPQKYMSDLISCYFLLFNKIF